MLSDILQGKAESTAVVQLQNPARPAGPRPETGSQEELDMPAGRWGRVDARDWSRARPA